MRFARSPIAMTAFALALAVHAAPAHARQTDEVAPERLTVGLALSGGSAKGFAHIGVLRELERMGVRIDVVTGTSMGSVIGGLYAIGMPTDSIADLISSIDWPTLIGDGAVRGRRFLHQRRFDERAVATLPLRGGIVSLPVGAVAGSNIVRLAEQATWRAATVRSFKDLPRPFAAVATDIETGEAITITGGVLAEALRASTGIPGAFEPFRLDGRLLVDGALSRNLPASDARDLGANLVICSDVSDPLASAEQLGSLVDVIDQVMTLSMRQSMIAQRSLCDIVVRPDVDGLSGFAFDRYEDWFERGVTAAQSLERELRAVAAGQSPRPPLSSPSAYLADSVRVVSVSIQGSARVENQRFVQGELRVPVGSFVTPEELADRLSDIDATGLFGLVHYRLDAVEGGVDLTVDVREQPKDRFGVGLRYDDERRAALLFTTTLHNLGGYGSVTRFDLRVGEETRGRITYRRRHGVTGRFEGGGSVSWSQGDLRLPGTLRPRSVIELTNLSLFIGLVGGRATFLGVEGTGEWAVAELSGIDDVLLASVTGVLDHESLDRIDFPRSGTDATMRWEWGVTDVVEGEGYSLFTTATRFFVPLHRRITVDVGGFVGVGRGDDLPLHRAFFLGGAHTSAVFARTQQTFNGLPDAELTGSAVQVARAALRAEVRPGIHARVGVDVGGTMDAWTFPIEDPVVGWSAGLGVGTLLGPVWLEWSWADPGTGGKLSIGVGRVF
jgi:NTE family protein